MELLVWTSLLHSLFSVFTEKHVVAAPVMYNTSISVTGYYGPVQWVNITVCKANMSWFEAFHECDLMDFSIATVPATGEKFLHLRDYLFRHFPELIGVPIWTGHQKPNLDGVWYSGDNCQQTTKNKVKDTYVNNTDSERQCLLMNMSVNTAPMANTWYATSCFEQHPFICELDLGTRPVDTYEGMQIQHNDSDTFVDIIYNVTAHECKLSARRSIKTFSAEHNSTSNTCTRYSRSVFDLPFEVNLTVNSLDNTSTSFVKSEENRVAVQYFSDIIPTHTYTYTDLPCYEFDTSTSTMCVPIESTAVFLGTTSTTLDTSSSLNQWTEEAKRENTVNKQTLSSYRNKRVSAKDDRPSSQAMGVLGAVFIAFVVFLVLMADLPRIMPLLRYDSPPWKPNKTKNNTSNLFSKMTNTFNRRNSV